MNIERHLKIALGTLFLIGIYTLLQQGPVFLSKMARYPIEFVAESPRKFVADLSGLPSGKYFVSVGRTLGVTEIYLNDVILQKGQLVAGVPIDFSNDKNQQRRLAIVWLASEEWRKHLFDQPVVTGYGIGFLIQEWRTFVGVFMGPISSLMLILFAIFNHRVSKNNSGQIFPHLICGVSGFVYGLYLSGLTDLFFSFETNLPYQIALRIVLSGAITYLISTYSAKSRRVLLGLHFISVGIVIFLSFVSPGWLIVLYKIELIFFVLATLIPTVDLMKVKSQSIELDLMVCLGLSLTVIEAFAGILYIFMGPSSWTVWSPSFIAVLAIANFFFIYKKAVSSSTEIQLSKRQYYLAAQIAHDIRSPLASLNAIAHSSTGMEEGTRLQIKSVVARIRDVANNLLRQDSLRSIANHDKDSFNYSDQDNKIFGFSLESNESQLIAHKLSSLVSEKRLQFSSRSGVEIYFNETSLQLPYFANIQVIEFGRVISNLIDNAVEAVTLGGCVSIDLTGDDDQIQIIIEDNGIGMSPEVLSKIGTRGFSFGKNGKESGSGLGVYHARETIRSWAGELKYESHLNVGTKATISIPRAKAPDWYVDKIYVPTSACVVILDDDLRMHEVWRERFFSAGGIANHIVSFSQSMEMIKWYRESLGVAGRKIYLVDYDILDDACTGLDLIEMLGIGSDAILVTNRWDDPVIVSRCKKFGVKILPKPIICFIEIR